jgi:signal transduction histidine kinase
MQSSGPLRRRLVAACVLPAIVIGGVFSAASYFVIEAAEYELIEARLMRAARVVSERVREGDVDARRFSDLKVYTGSQIPADWRALSLGVQEISIGDSVLQVLLAEEGGERFAIVVDVSDFERLEAAAYMGLVVAFLAGALLALAIAHASASRIIAPITVLAEAVERDTLAENPKLLAAPDEIGVLARAFAARASQLARVLERERNFTADVSHELRTPLTVVLGASELLTARLADRADLLVVAERIRRATSGMSERVSALLQLARDPSRIEIATLALRPLLEREVERCRPLLDGKPVRLELEIPHEVWVAGNADLAAIAVNNLLRNAFHFTERGSVRIALAADALVIEDTGPGIAKSIRHRLFEPFVRGDDTSATGTGLGLSIVKRVADHLGWLVGVDDSPRGGARFTLRFAEDFASPARAR